MPPLYRIDLGNEVFYALDENEKESILARLKNKRQTQCSAFQRAR